MFQWSYFGSILVQWVRLMWRRCGQTAQIHENQSPYKGIHKGGPAAEGRRPPFVEAAEGRLLYIWAREAEDIAKTYANMY